MQSSGAAPPGRAYRLRAQRRGRDFDAVRAGDAPLRTEIPVGDQQPGVQRVGERLFHQRHDRGGGGPAGGPAPRWGLLHRRAGRRQWQYGPEVQELEAQLKAQQVYEQASGQAVWSLGRPSGSCGFRRGEPSPATYNFGPGDSRGFFVGGGERKGESLPAESRQMSCFTICAPRSVERATIGAIKDCLPRLADLHVRKRFNPELARQVHLRVLTNILGERTFANLKL